MFWSDCLEAVKGCWNNVTDGISSGCRRLFSCRRCSRGTASEKRTYTSQSADLKTPLMDKGGRRNKRGGCDNVSACATYTCENFVAFVRHPFFSWSVTTVAPAVLAVCMYYAGQHEDVSNANFLPTVNPAIRPQVEAAVEYTDEFGEAVLSLVKSLSGFFIFGSRNFLCYLIPVSILLAGMRIKEIREDSRKLKERLSNSIQRPWSDRMVLLFNRFHKGSLQGVEEGKAQVRKEDSFQMIEAPSLFLTLGFSTFLLAMLPAGFDYSCSINPPYDSPALNERFVHPLCLLESLSNSATNITMMITIGLSFIPAGFFAGKLIHGMNQKRMKDILEFLRKPKVSEEQKPDSSDIKEPSAVLEHDRGSSLSNSPYSVLRGGTRPAGPHSAIQARAERKKEAKRQQRISGHEGGSGLTPGESSDKSADFVWGVSPQPEQEQGVSMQDIGHFTIFGHDDDEPPTEGFLITDGRGGVIASRRPSLGGSTGSG